jgi:hypothetical protein
MKYITKILIALAIIIPLGAIAMTSDGITSEGAQSLFAYQTASANWTDQGNNVSTRVITTTKTICTIASVMGTKTWPNTGSTVINVPMAISASISCVPFSK